MKTSASSETPAEPFSPESGEGLLPRHPGEKSVPRHSSEESSLRDSSEASSLRHSRESSPPAGARNPSSPAAKTRECVVVLDFGSQYSPLIVRRIRECGVYAELMPYDADEETVRALNPRALVLSGGPASAYAPGAPRPQPFVWQGKLPVLGICYGMQLMAQALGGSVAPADRREYGHAMIHAQQSAGVFTDIAREQDVWMSHGDHITALPPGFDVLASSANSPIAAMGNAQGMIGIQFHPEVAHTPQGTEILRNFLFEVCGLRGDWTPAAFIDEAVAQIQSQVGAQRVILALSGGVDSTVAAALLHRAIGDRLINVFVDNGLLRLNEPEQVEESLTQLGIPVRRVDARELFLGSVSGCHRPGAKRRIIGETFIDVFEEEATRHAPVDFLAQGTIYSDVIESRAPDSKAASRIKSHHNVGGLPETMRLQLVEPLRTLFKDEVRNVGEELGLPHELVWRHPFPGPGLAVRVLGAVTAAKLEIVRLADAILTEELRAAGLYEKLWQVLAVLPNVQSVGVMGDERTYDHLVALRAIESQDAMTANWAHIPHDVLARISSRIVNEVPHVNRVVYDITNKPPATIEWE